MYNYLIKINFISKHQHGFCFGRSTLTNLLETYNFVTDNLDNKKAVDLIFIDFEKAFDRLDINLLIQKLLYIKCPNYIVVFLQIFLLNRLQKVSVRDVLSGSLPVLSGVPQGCVISPLLFLIYINDIFNLPISSNLKLFADDSKLYNLSENFHILESDLSLLNEWCKANFVNINVSKSFVLHFGKEDGRMNYKVDDVALRRTS